MLAGYWEIGLFGQNNIQHSLTSQHDVISIILAHMVMTAFFQKLNNRLMHICQKVLQWCTHRSRRLLALLTSADLGIGHRIYTTNKITGLGLYMILSWGNTVITFNTLIIMQTILWGLQYKFLQSTSTIFTCATCKQAQGKGRSCFYDLQSRTQSTSFIRRTSAAFCVQCRQCPKRK